MKIDVSKVAEVLKKNELEPALLRRIIEELNLIDASAADAGDKGPAVKKQFVFVLSDPEGRLPQVDFIGWVLQIPDSESPATILERIHRAAYDYNTTKRGRLQPCITVGETIEAVPARFFKEADAWVKTKTPVLVVKTNNIVPGTDALLNAEDRAALAAKSAPAAA